MKFIFGSGSGSRSQNNFGSTGSATLDDSDTFPLGQSPDQKDLIREIPEKTALYVEGAFRSVRAVFDPDPVLDPHSFAGSAYFCWIRMLLLDPALTGGIKI